MLWSILLVGVCWWMALPQPAQGAIYKWVNADGSVGFSDDLSKVPETARKEIELKAYPLDENRGNPAPQGNSMRPSTPASPKAPVTTATGAPGSPSGKAELSEAEKRRIDAELRTLWETMKAALRVKDIEGALRCFTPTQQARYRTLFGATRDQLPQIVQAMEPIQPIYIEDPVAQYRLLRTELVNGQPTPITYYVYFIHMTDGTWRIRDF